MISPLIDKLPPNLRLVEVIFTLAVTLVSTPVVDKPYSVESEAF
jgi:hypothetical protein